MHTGFVDDHGRDGVVHPVPICNTVLMFTYNGGEAVSLNINGLDQGRFVESRRASGGPNDALGTSVQAEGRGGGRKDGEECKGGDLHDDKAL